jgi:hypothetical protein
MGFTANGECILLCPDGFQYGGEANDMKIKSYYHISFLDSRCPEFHPLAQKALAPLQSHQWVRKSYSSARFAFYVVQMQPG